MPSLGLTGRKKADLASALKGAKRKDAVIFDWICKREHAAASMLLAYYFREDNMTIVP
jgi:hypothetical protein